MSPMRPDLVACWLFRASAGGSLEILLIRRAPERMYPGLWQCVTGRLEDDETPLEGALREVAEETGAGPADIEATYETDLVNWFHEVVVGGLMSEAVFAARVRPGTEISLSDEHDDARWVDAAGAHALVLWPAYHTAIERLEWLFTDSGAAAVLRLPDRASHTGPR